MKVKVVLQPQEEGGYTVTVPSLPGCISEGDTREEALLNIKEAIELYTSKKATVERQINVAILTEIALNQNSIARHLRYCFFVAAEITGGTTLLLNDCGSP